MEGTYIQSFLKERLEEEIDPVDACKNNPLVGGKVVDGMKEGILLRPLTFRGLKATRPQRSRRRGSQSLL